MKLLNVKLVYKLKKKLLNYVHNKLLKMNVSVLKLNRLLKLRLNVKQKKRVWLMLNICDLSIKKS